METPEDESLTVQKQELLQTEIIDKNYDKEAFINFCLLKKDNGDDLASWSVDELKDIVKEFTSSHKEVHKDEEDVKVEQVESMEKINAEPPQKHANDITIQCRKLEKTDLSNNQITVVVRNPKEMDKGVIAQKYILYEVYTESMKWTVTRRFSDFDWLRKMLIKLFPGYIVPPLPTKKMGNRRFDEDFVQKRMKFLDLFINSVCKSEVFKCSEALIAFLSFVERPKFESKMKELLSFKPSEYIEEYKTIDGKAIINHDECNEKYFININKYFNLQSSVLSKLSFNLKNFYNFMTSAADALEQVQKNFDILHILNTRVLMKHQITKSYEELGAFFKNWRKIIIKQNDIFKYQIKDFFKFINLEGTAYSELINSREEMKAKYTSEFQRVIAKKEKIWIAKDISKFELNPDDPMIDKAKLMSDKAYAFEKMCFKDNQIVKLYHNQLGYLNKMNILELKKMIKIYCKRFIDNLKKFDTDFYNSLTDGISSWTNLETFVQGCLAEQQLAEMQKQLEMRKNEA